MFFKPFYLLYPYLIIIISLDMLSASPDDWKTVEKLVEEHPYIVALLNNKFEYICTGTIISENTILTSGSCVNLYPKRVAVGVVVIYAETIKKSTFAVASTRLHADFSFEMKAAEPNVTRMQSNIGLVFVVRHMLELFIPAVEIGNYFASELQNAELTTVGFGQISKSRSVVLQYEIYNQSPCANPRWYYCVCGVEVSKLTNHYEKDFGNGAPVFFGKDLVGVAASATGTLYLKTTGVKYNIFTIIGPYKTWLEKIDTNSTVVKKLTQSIAVQNHGSLILIFFNLLLLINKMY